MNIENLNPSQRKAVEYNGKHLLVLAGAGTGKTHTIISRAAYLIANGVQGKRIQILSFTRKSASEIVERVNSMFRESKDAKQLNGSTFHAWCMNIIKTNPKVFKVSDYTVIDRDDQLGVFKLICGRNPKVIDETRLNAKTLLDLYSFARNTRKNITETVRFKCLNNSKDGKADKEIEKIKPYLVSVFSTYESKKRERKYLDYDDILNVVAIGLKNNKEARDYITSQYDHILVDEMQDTNPLQWELLSSFQEKCCLFCVGDDAQSIYAFRGADFTNVHKFNERVPDSEIYRLEDNYRSTQEILDLSNWLLKQSPLCYNKKLNATRGSGELPVIMNFENEWREADWVACDILDNFTKDGLEYNNHLVLVRSVYAGRSIERSLLEKKIPYVVFGGVGLMASAHIRDVASALRIIANIYDEIAWMRYLQLWEKIGDVTASNLITELLELSDIDECLVLLKKKNLKDQGLVDTLSAIKGLNNKPSDAIRIALAIMESRLAINYKGEWEKKRKPDFQVLMQLAEKHGSISEFIAEYVLDPQLNEASAFGSDSKEAVTISTIHSAKGLEAKVCYVINVSVGAYPSTRSIDEGEDAVEEERRVLYVALTRAKDELYVTRIITKIQDYSQSRIQQINSECEGVYSSQIIEQQDDTDSEKKSTVYFLDELPSELVIDKISEQTRFEISTKTYTGKPIAENDFGMDLS
ncbi:MAG: ATP-dependent helicase [Bacteroidales bacterium]|nr:ATP-dependent helicase [Bacteroidales bacterium]